MDIDEFLDRELVELGLGSGKEEKDIELPVLNEKGEDISLPESADSSLAKGNLEQAEQEFMRLWRVLAQRKLNWDKGVYEQLDSICKRFSGALSQAYEESKKKEGTIRDMIGRGRNALKDGKKDIPMKIYAQLQELASSMPAVFFEEKKAVQEQIINYYREIANANDAELSRKVNGLGQQISQLINSINSSIASNDIVTASSNYGKCVELYNQIPGGFLMAKNAAGIKILDIYKRLSILNEIGSLQSQLGHKVPLPARVYAQNQPPRIEPRLVRQKWHLQKMPHESRIAESAKIESQNLRSFQSQKGPPLKVEGKRNAWPESRQAALLKRKIESTKRNLRKGFLNEAWKDTEDALQLKPGDVEIKALRAKIKTLQ